jgi:transposase-like protein
VHQSGRREVIGLDVGEAETEAFWREFLRGLRARGLQGVRLCVSDAHQGLKTAIATVLGCPWQRCRVHWARKETSWSFWVSRYDNVVCEYRASSVIGLPCGSTSCFLT